MHSAVSRIAIVALVLLAAIGISPQPIFADGNLEFVVKVPKDQVSIVDLSTDPPTWQAVPTNEVEFAVKVSHMSSTGEPNREADTSGGTRQRVRYTPEPVSEVAGVFAKR